MKSGTLNQRKRKISRGGRSRNHKMTGGGGSSRSYYWWPITNAKIRQAVQKVVDTINPEKIILFGSFAHGKPNPDSDVDLLIIMKSDRSPHARARQVSEILYPRPFPVDIIVRTPAEVAERLALGDCFFNEIFTKGKVLYERASG